MYEIADGRVLTWSLESHIVDHCNLRCAECCTLSPHLAPRAVAPEALARDLARAAGALRPNVFKLTGGEPLLHPEVVRCLEVARASRIAGQVSMTTNGFRLPRAPDALFELLDRLTLSVYSSAPLPEKVVEVVAERCARHGVILTVKRIDRFGRMSPEAPLSEERAGAVHASCWLKVRCHLVYEGRFYTCTRPPHLGASLAAADGVDLAQEGLLEKLLAYLESGEPLASCRQCLGSSGGFLAHRQLDRGRHPGQDGEEKAKPDAFRPEARPGGPAPDAAPPGGGTTPPG